MSDAWEGKYSVSSEELANRLRGLSQVLQEATLRHVISLSRNHPKVLEIGCGTGQHSIALARFHPDGEYVATDYAASVIAETRALAEAAHVHIDARVADITQLPFDDHVFDIVFGDHVIAHVPDLDRAIRECARVLKPGGYLVINASNALRPDGWRLYHMLTPKPYLWRDFFPWELRALVKKGGFSVARSHGSTVYLDRGIKKLFKKSKTESVGTPGKSVSDTSSNIHWLRRMKRGVFRVLEQILPPFLMVEYGVVARKAP